MTGRPGNELVAQSTEVERLCKLYGVIALDPIKSEGVKAEKKPLNNGGDLLVEYWKRDKAMIKSAHVIIDVTGPAKSEGVAHEIGYGRYFLYKPIIRVYPGLKTSIARLEDDYIAGSLDDAIFTAVKEFGTLWKRLLWRLKLYNRCLPGMIAAFFREWRNCIW